MKTFREKCLDFFKSEDMKKDVRQVLQIIYGMMYNEVYPYIWLICIYHVILIFVTLANLGLLMKFRQ